MICNDDIDASSFARPNTMDLEPDDEIRDVSAAISTMAAQPVTELNRETPYKVPRTGNGAGMPSQS